MSPSFTPPPVPSHIAPVACEKCAAAARLIRRAPDAFKRDGRTEIRTFECAACGHQTTVTAKA